MGDSFFKVKRSKATEELLKDRNAWTLLSLIAYRARRTNEFNIHNLDPGEALIGDFKSCGLTTRQEYREALKRLVNWKFVTIRTTNKGTIVKLINSNIFDINIEENNQQDNHRTTIKQPSNNHPATTNKNEKNDKNEKKERTRALEKLTSEKPSQEEQKQKYGEYVFLFPGEHFSLVERFGAAGATDRIEALNLAIASKGYKYLSHYATILSWDRRDQKKSGNTQIDVQDNPEGRQKEAKREYNRYKAQGLPPAKLEMLKDSLSKKHKVDKGVFE